MRLVTTTECKGLWAILWRVVFLGPLVGILGLAFVTMILAILIVPPIYAGFAFYAGDWMPAIGSVLGWILVLPFGKPVFRWTFQGADYASI